MLNITGLNTFCSALLPIDSTAFGAELLHPGPAETPDHAVETHRKPRVTWRVTRSCNMNCRSCVSDPLPSRDGSELNTREGIDLIADLATFGVPSLLFARGEPLLREDLVEWVAYTHERGVQPSLHTNGTLLGWTKAEELRSAGLPSVGILLEGLGREVDCRRGAPGVFDAVLEGYASCEAAGLATEIRTPLHRWNYSRLAELLGFIERRQIRRVVFVHLVYAGRGNSPNDDLTHDEKRRALDLIIEAAEDFSRRGISITMATDENHADGIYLYLRWARRDPRRATSALRLLQSTRADVHGSGVGLAGIGSWGEVRPDPYWAYTLGNVRARPFGEIWRDNSDSLLCGLRDRLPRLKGRCAKCRWKPSCGGNLRVRAQEFFGDPWMSDPACYLTEEEIGKEVMEQVAAMEDDVLLSGQAA